MKAYLVFEDGEVFPGTWIGTPREMAGEVVFTTGMTGDPEVMTDPAHAGQIVTFTYPLIGNCGPVPEGEGVAPPRCAGVVVSELCAEGRVGAWLDCHGVPGITGVDTRRVVRKVREKGAIRGVITSTPAPRVEAWPDPRSLRWVKETTVPDRIQLSARSPEAPHLVLIDLGGDASTLAHLRRQGCRVTVVPFSTPRGNRRVGPGGSSLLRRARGSPGSAPLSGRLAASAAPDPQPGGGAGTSGVGPGLRSGYGTAGLRSSGKQPSGEGNRYGTGVDHLPKPWVYRHRLLPESGSLESDPPPCARWVSGRFGPPSPAPQLHPVPSGEPGGGEGVFPVFTPSEGQKGGGDPWLNLR